VLRTVARPQRKNYARRNVAFVVPSGSRPGPSTKILPRLLLEAYSPPPGAAANDVICVALALIRSVKSSMPAPALVPVSAPAPAPLMAKM